MITQQELTDKCTPEIIKKMCELAEGFSMEVKGNHLKHDKTGCFDFTDRVMNNDLLFPLLIHRAVEGWNKSNICRPIQILVNCVMWITDKDNPVSIEYGYEDYRPTTLTHAECAILDCLLEVL